MYEVTIFLVLAPSGMPTLASLLIAADATLQRAIEKLHCIAKSKTKWNVCFNQELQFAPPLMNGKYNQNKGTRLYQDYQRIAVAFCSLLETSHPILSKLTGLRA
jgi:hypothetical protein